ncbi:RHOMBOID-like protein 10, chloroplastic [Humulus lupulus]|uniref:RHOMBOID-like protein 10, chloroplastic n=1 Tax=Humulus lupulus TaxID=3486 RepID=UPI002B408066|nr:RHOMBOID-like protein 10, chloroplastic [Humulus lupulus]
MKITIMIRSGLWPLPQPFRFGSPSPASEIGPTPMNVLTTTATSIRLGHLIHHGVKPLLRSYFQKLGRLSHGPRLGDSLVSASWARIFLFGEEENGKELGKRGISSSNSKSNTSSPSPFEDRGLTNVLLALNVAIFIAQIASNGRLISWGAKVNNLIEEGQLWRLVTSSFLHANVGHLLVNCYSLNSVGPSVEKISGPGRFIAIYFVSAIASSAMSCMFSSDPAVGASGAIFGLVGSVAVFVMRHRGQVGGGRSQLQHIVNVIALNMVIGLVSEGIDNWGHLGGLLGGAAASWLLGPVWDYETRPTDGRRILADRAPIFNLFNWKSRS